MSQITLDIPKEGLPSLKHVATFGLAFHRIKALRGSGTNLSLPIIRHNNPH